ncbi:RNA recognition motif protein [Gregarina niphandrodes]|uniref:RNA recognition motif protein n=1 Tax=Gregarina niphandrodes TaxID=110365 RepID=A0A023BDD5_GRENI|nr:RNA recognition motif protein [Gregarina niphandrodes]EZG87172.1 RNA recognition motif protein [Gregarina niphandrodes]|eukprot:XP_011128691.1 RNA recognition motif protein [Gregarina niphandrodes]
MFSSAGEVRKVWIDYDRTDRSLGTGGVIFNDYEDARAAVDRFSGLELDGSVITLTLEIHPDEPGVQVEHVAPVGGPGPRSVNLDMWFHAEVKVPS